MRMKQLLFSSGEKSYHCCVPKQITLPAYRCAWPMQSCLQHSLVECWCDCNVWKASWGREDLRSCSVLLFQCSTLRVSLACPPSVSSLSVERLQLMPLFLAAGITLCSLYKCYNPHSLLCNILVVLRLNSITRRHSHLCQGLANPIFCCTLQPI